MNELAAEYNCEIPLYTDIDIPANGSKYDAQTKYRAAACYALYGNSKRVSDLMNIPRRTVLDWMQTEWWAKLNAKLREEKGQEFNAGFSRLIEKGIKVIENQLDSNEVKAIDAAKIMGIAFDKRQILNNMPTSIQGKAHDINQLQGEFERYLAAKEIKITATDTATE